MKGRRLMCWIYSLISILLILVWILFIDEMNGSLINSSPFAPTYGQAEIITNQHSQLFIQQQGKPPTDRPMIDFKENFERINETLRILMLIVVRKGTNLDTYSNALGSMQCYATIQNYDFQVVDDSAYPMCQRIKDFMFRRHCIVLEFLPKYDYLVFLDGDMAVVNPKRRFEEYIDASADITFYERIENWEFAAGSYIAKNSKWTIEFLGLFAEYEKQLPKSFHGTDNGALHIFIAELMYPDLHEDLKTCWSIYRQSKGYDSLFTYEACVRNIMGFRRRIGNIRIMEKGTSWVRDIWLTDSRWSRERDFMLHALQEQRRIKYQEKIQDRANMGPRHLYYYDPFLLDSDWSKCQKNHQFEWPLDTRLIISSDEISSIIDRIKREREKKRWKFSGYVENYINV